MARLQTDLCRVLLVGFLLSNVAPLVYAQEKGAHGAEKKAHGPANHGEEHHSLKYEAIVKPEGEEEREMVFDMTNPQQKAQLMDFLAQGRVEELKTNKPVNIFELSWDLGLWTLVVFLLLLFILRKIAWGPMLEGLKKREANIKNALEEAKKAQEESRRLQEEMAKQMAGAQDRIKAVMDEARRSAQEAADEMITKAKGEITAERQRLHREVEIARDQALEDISSRAADLATLVASKALGRIVTMNDQERLVQESIAELGRAKVR